MELKTEISAKRRNNSRGLDLVAFSRLWKDTMIWECKWMCDARTNKTTIKPRSYLYSNSNTRSRWLCLSSSISLKKKIIVSLDRVFYIFGYITCACVMTEKLFSFYSSMISITSKQDRMYLGNKNIYAAISHTCT